MSEITNSRVVVTGASGFIGRHLCSELHQRGYQVKAVSRKIIYNSFSFENVFINDIGPETNWDAALDQIDYVVHLAALAHQIGKKVPDEAFDRTNHIGTDTLARFIARKPSIKRLIFISSIGAVCSMSDQVVKSLTPCHPDNAYGRSKLAAEQSIRVHLSSTSADFCILRPTLVYGSENPGNMLRLVQLVRKGLPLPFGSISNRRSFIYVGNLVQAIIHALTAPGVSRQTYNLADEEVFSTPDLIKALARQQKRNVTLLPFPKMGLKLLGKVGDLLATVRGRSLGIDSYSVDRLLGSLEVDHQEFCKAARWSHPFTAEQGFQLTLSS